MSTFPPRRYQPAHGWTAWMEAQQDCGLSFDPMSGNQTPAAAWTPASKIFKSHDPLFGQQTQLSSSQTPPHLGEGLQVPGRAQNPVNG